MHSCILDCIGIWFYDERGKRRQHSAENPAEAAEEDVPDLDSLRAIREAVWGKGFLLPGGGDAALALTAPARLEEGMSVLCLGAGLGGGCRAVATEWGAEVEGLEADDAIVEEAMGRTKAPVGEKTVSIRAYMPLNARLRVNTYNCIFAQEAFFNLMAKKGLFEKIWNALKEDSHFLFTDLVYATQYAAEEPPVQKWCDNEPSLPDCWTMEQYKETLTGFGFSIQETTDYSEWYLALIGEKWLEFIESLSDRKTDSQFTDLVMKEAQMWQSRMKALKSGHLRYIRVHAYRMLDKDIK